MENKTNTYTVLMANVEKFHNTVLRSDIVKLANQIDQANSEGQIEPPVIAPFYDDGQIKIYNGNFESVLPQLDERFDMILTDPPYGMNKADWDKESNYDWYATVFEMLEENASVYVFCGDNTYIEARTKLERYFNFHRTIIWQKENVYGGGDYLLAHEYLLYAKRERQYLTTLGEKYKQRIKSSWQRHRKRHQRVEK